MPESNLRNRGYTFCEIIFQTPSNIKGRVVVRGVKYVISIIEVVRRAVRSIVSSARASRCEEIPT